MSSKNGHTRLMDIMIPVMALKAALVSVQLAIPI